MEFNPNDINSIIAGMAMCRLAPNPQRWENLYNKLYKLLNEKLQEEKLK